MTQKFRVQFNDRVYSSGVIRPGSTSYILETTAYASGGQSGGPAFIEYTLNGDTYRSAIGIITSGHISSSPRYSKALRITTPVLRFYYDNQYI